MRETRGRPVFLVAVAAAICLTACASDEAAVCEDVDTLESSVEGLKDVQVSEDGLSTLSSDVTQIQEDVAQLRSDAKSEFGDEVDQVQSMATTLEGSLEAAKSAPSPSTLSAVATAIESVDSSVSALGDALTGTC